MHLFLMLVVGTVPHGSHKRHNAEGHHLRQEGRGFRSNLRDRIYTYIHRYTRTFIGCTSQYPFLCQYLSLSLSVCHACISHIVSAPPRRKRQGGKENIRTYRVAQVLEESIHNRLLEWRQRVHHLPQAHGNLYTHPRIAPPGRAKPQRRATTTTHPLYSVCCTDIHKHTCV